MKSLIAALLFVALPALAQVRQVEDTDSRVAAEALAGVPVNGFPQWEERVIHEWINRARSDPQYEMSRCGNNCPERACYTPQPPLAWSDALGRAARFHADEMLAQSYFAHDSQCVLLPSIVSSYPIACDGSAECACVGATKSCGSIGCTKWYDRVGLFGVYATGEIIASPPEPNTAFYMWLYEGSTSAQCAYNGLNGHRWNILQSFGAVGAGTTRAAAVADFGRGESASGIASAAHYPRGGSTPEIWANWYGAAPKAATAIVDGSCISMTLARGSAANGAWVARPASLTAGCHSYYVSFTDASGNVSTYPESGSYAIGSADCGDWTAARHRASCAPLTSRKRPIRR